MPRDAKTVAQRGLTAVSAERQRREAERVAEAMDRLRRAIVVAQRRRVEAAAGADDQKVRAPVLEVLGVVRVAGDVQVDAVLLEPRQQQRAVAVPPRTAIINRVSFVE